MPIRILFLATIYGLGLFTIQCQCVGTLSYTSFQIDLLFPLMFLVSLEFPFTVAVSWALGWGIVVDSFTARMWGLNAVSYLAIVLVAKSGNRSINLYNTLCRAMAVTFCAALQSSVVISLLCLDGSTKSRLGGPLWLLIIIRAIISGGVTPLIALPFDKCIARTKVIS